MRHRLLHMAGAGLAVIAAAGCGGPVPAPDPFTVGSEAFNPQSGHIQGIAATRNALYLSQSQHLVKVDWTGRPVCSRASTNHTGDICWYRGRLYASLALTDAEGMPGADSPEGVGKIQVFDRHLKLVKEAVVDRRIDGITCMDGILYVGMGSKTQPSREPHRINIIGRFDARTLEEIAPRVEFDYGFETKFGVQDITNDGRNVYLSFYSVGGAPQIAVTDKDLNLVGTLSKEANQGLDVMPQSMSAGSPLFVKAKTVTSKNPAQVSCIIDFWTPRMTQ